MCNQQTGEYSFSIRIFLVLHVVIESTKLFSDQKLGVLPPKCVLTILTVKIWNSHTLSTKILYSRPQDCSQFSHTKILVFPKPPSKFPHPQSQLFWYSCVFTSSYLSVSYLRSSYLRHHNPLSSEKPGMTPKIRYFSLLMAKSGILQVVLLMNSFK